MLKIRIPYALHAILAALAGLLGSFGGALLGAKYLSSSFFLAFLFCCAGLWLGNYVGSIAFNLLVSASCKNCGGKTRQYFKSLHYCYQCTVCGAGFDTRVGIGDSD